MRDIIAERTSLYFIWGSDSGGWGYAFGRDQRTSTEHITAVHTDSGERIGSYRVYETAVAIEITDRAIPPDTIRITLAEREELLRQRQEAAS